MELHLICICTIIVAPQCGLPQSSISEPNKIEYPNKIYKQERPHINLIRKNKWDNPTPKNRKSIKPIKLFRKIHDKHLSHKERNEKFKINEDVEEMNFQALLMNT